MLETYKKNYRLKGVPIRYQELIEGIKPIAEDYYFRWSFKGVPHLLVTLKNQVTYSLCYFGKSKSWKVFYPYQDKDQQKVNFRTREEMLEYLQGISQC